MFLWPCREARRPWPCCCFCSRYMPLSKLPQSMDRCVPLTGLKPLGSVYMNIRFAAILHANWACLLTDKMDDVSLIPCMAHSLPPLLNQTAHQLPQSLSLWNLLLQESFRLGAIYVDETVACDSSEAASSARIEKVQRTVSLLDGRMPFHSASLEDALCSGEECEGGDSSGRERRCQTGDLINVSLSCVLGCKCVTLLLNSGMVLLQYNRMITSMYRPALSWMICHPSHHDWRIPVRHSKAGTCMQAVEDTTGREDLTEALRNALLIRLAARHGYNKVARGDSATCVAARVIAMSSKGSGFALPACIQYFDRRWECCHG